MSQLISSLPESESPPASPPRIWRAGTLTYSGVGLAVLFGWLLWGDFAWNMKERAAVPVAQLMLKRFEASDLLIGILVGSLPSALGMILGPVISVRSDRHRGRWGRRIPFLLVPIPIAVLAMAGLAFVPEIGPWLHRALGLHSPGLAAANLIAFGIFWTMFEISAVVSNSTFGGLINDVVPQEIIGRFFGLFRAFGLIAGILFNYKLMEHAEKHFTAIFLGVAVLYGVGFGTMCFKVREGGYPPPAPLPPGSNGNLHPLLSAKTYVRECYSNPYYRWLFTGMTLAMLASGPVNAFSVFYAKSVGMTMKDYGWYLALTYVISLALSYLLGAVADRFHPLRAGIVAIALYLLAMAWGAGYAKTPGTYAIALVAHGVFSGIFLTCTASWGQRLFPREKYAQFASANGIVGAVGYLVMPPLVGALLDATHHVYRYTFAVGGGVALAALAALLIVHRKFMQLGGVAGYVAPV